MTSLGEKEKMRRIAFISKFAYVKQLDASALDFVSDAISKWNENTPSEWRRVDAPSDSEWVSAGLILGFMGNVAVQARGGDSHQIDVIPIFLEHFFLLSEAVIREIEASSAAHCTIVHIEEGSFLLVTGTMESSHSAKHLFLIVVREIDPKLNGIIVHPGWNSVPPPPAHYTGAPASADAWPEHMRSIGLNEQAVRIENRRRRRTIFTSVASINYDFDAVFSSIDSKKSRLISLLSEAVAIPSVSAEPERRPEVVRMVQWAKQHLEGLGATYEIVEPGIEPGTSIPLPPIILATLGTDPAKKTLLIYAHLDVHPAAKEDGWNTEPFKLTEKDGKLYARGASDDKGPFIAWLVALEALKEQGVELPVNLKFCLEGMEESGSLGLDDALKAHKASFFSGVSFTCIAEGKHKLSIVDPSDGNYQAAARATKRVRGFDAGSTPMKIIQELTGASVMILPIGACDDMAHSPNEKIDVTNLVQGTKTLAAYILELAKIA